MSIGNFNMNYSKNIMILNIGNPTLLLNDLVYGF